MSKAREDFPEPLSPVKTMKRSRGMFRLIFLRLCSLAPTMVMAVIVATCGHSKPCPYLFSNTGANGAGDLFKYGRRYTPV